MSASQPTAPACEMGFDVFYFLFSVPKNLRIPGLPSLAQYRILPPYSLNTPSDGVLTLEAIWAHSLERAWLDALLLTLTLTRALWGRTWAHELSPLGLLNEIQDAQINLSFKWTNNFLG